MRFWIFTNIPACASLRPVESNPNILYHERVGSERTTEQRDELDQNPTPTEQSAQETIVTRTL